MRLLLIWLITHVIFPATTSRCQLWEKTWDHRFASPQLKRWTRTRRRRRKDFFPIRWLFPHCDQGKASLTTTTTLLKTSGGVCSGPTGAPSSFHRSTVRTYQPKQPSIHSCVSSPIKRGFLSTVEGILQLFDQVGLSWQSEQTLLPKAPLPDEIHALLHQHRGELVPEPAFIPHRLLQLLTKDPWNTTCFTFNGEGLISTGWFCVYPIFDSYIQIVMTVIRVLKVQYVRIDSWIHAPNKRRTTYHQISVVTDRGQFKER